MSFVYFATLGIVALIRRLPAGSRAAITGIAGSMCAAILLVERDGGDLVRTAMPIAVILIGYYLSGRFAIEPSVRFEARLLSWDERLFGNPATRFAGWPRALLAVLEVLYMGCFLLVPAGLAGLRLTAAPQALIDRYWTFVIGAEFGSFMSIAFAYARPPWVLEQRAALPDRAVHRAATRFVERLTIRANTFPSGHAAGSLAVALGVIGALPAVGLVMFVLAIAICVAAVVGRYHYAADVVAGLSLALAIFALFG